MAWLSRNNWATAEAMTAAALNNLANDIRAWGGDVNAGGFALSNIANITGSSNKLGIGTTAPACAVDIYSGGTLWKNNPTYELFATTDRVVQVRGAGQAAVNLVSDVTADGGSLGGVYFGRSAGQADAHIQVSGIRGVQIGTGVTAGGGIAFFAKGLGAPGEMARLTGVGFGIGLAAPATPLHVQAHVSNEIARFVARVDSSNNRAFVSLYSTNPAYWWEVSQQDAAGGGTANGLAFRERSAAGSSVERLFLAQGGNVGVNKMAPNSKFAVVGLPTYADNAAALGGGLTAGDFYRTSTGVLMVAY